MDATGLWLLGYGANVVFWAWVIWWGGAEWLEGRFASGFLISWLAPRWSADGIKLFGWLSLLATSAGFVIGLFVPELRWFPHVLF